MSYPDKGQGQYDLEYKACPCFWGLEPGKFVKSVLKQISSGKVLDLGAGEGKNAIYLAELGFNVTAVEVSSYAIDNFKSRLSKLSDEIKDRITIIHKDALALDLNEEFDLVIAYGLLHCMSSLTKVDLLIDRIKAWTSQGGLTVIVSFNDTLGVPKVQDYLEPTLLPRDYLRRRFSDFTITNYEDDIITETHPTSNIEHNHGVSRIIAIKSKNVTE